MPLLLDIISGLDKSRKGVKLETSDSKALTTNVPTRAEELFIN